jgi:hypothetical protein
MNFTKEIFLVSKENICHQGLKRHQLFRDAMENAAFKDCRVVRGDSDCIPSSLLPVA